PGDRPVDRKHCDRQTGEADRPDSVATVEEWAAGRTVRRRYAQLRIGNLKWNGRSAEGDQYSGTKAGCVHDVSGRGGTESNEGAAGHCRRITHPNGTRFVTNWPDQRSVL